MPANTQKTLRTTYVRTCTVYTYCGNVQSTFGRCRSSLFYITLAVGGLAAARQRFSWLFLRLPSDRRSIETFGMCCQVRPQHEYRSESSKTYLMSMLDTFGELLKMAHLTFTQSVWVTQTDMTVNQSMKLCFVSKMVTIGPKANFVQVAKKHELWTLERRTRSIS